MERICAEKTGLFPSPAEIQFTCSCPDWATMCKHVAAVLYGVGARLDARPELLFELRGVDQGDLIARAGKDLPLARKGPAAGRVLAEEGLSELFGIDLAEGVRSRDREAPAGAPGRQARGWQACGREAEATAGGAFGVARLRVRAPWVDPEP